MNGFIEEYDVALYMKTAIATFNSIERILSQRKVVEMLEYKLSIPLNGFWLVERVV